METKIAIYHSDDETSEEYWDVAQTAKDFNIKLTNTDSSNFGGETIFIVEGLRKDIQEFAVEFVGVDDLEYIEEL